MAAEESTPENHNAAKLRVPAIMLWLWRVLSGAITFGAGILALGIGFLDFLSTVGLVPKIQALLLLVLGLTALVTLICGIILRRGPDSPKWSPLIDLTLGLATLLIGMTFLIPQSTHGDHETTRTLSVFILWLAAVVAGSLTFAGAAAAVIHAVDISRPLVIVGAILSATVTTSLVQFWYDHYYAPLQERPLVLLQVDLKRAGNPVHAMFPVDVTLSMRNASGVRAQILGTLYTASSITTARRAINHQFPIGVHAGVGLSVTGSSATRFTTSTGKIIQEGPFFPLGTYLEPNETSTVHFVIYVPSPASPATVAVSAAMAIAQGERLQLGQPLVSDLSCVADAKHHHRACPRLAHGVVARIAVWRVAQPSHFERLITSPRYVFTALIEHARGVQVPYLATSVDTSPDPADTDFQTEETLGKNYFLVSQFATDELHLHAKP